jgi:amidase
MARAGGQIPNRTLERARASEASLAKPLLELFDQVDVLLAPVVSRPTMLAESNQGKGALGSLLAAGRFVPFPGTWNMTGQPACSIPAGQTEDGVPIGVQLVGRPNSEAMLLSLSAQIEAESPWRERRPPIS